MPYVDLPSWFLLFSVFDATNTCLGWDATAEWAALLDLHLVPVLWRGTWDEAQVRALTDGIDTSRREGLVVRLADPWPFEAFGQSVAKWVRPGHVTTDQHWMSRPIVPNGLRGRP